MVNRNLYILKLQQYFFMREGAYIGALIALLVYFMLPIYTPNGAPASVFPTGNAVSNADSFNSYVTNLPFSSIIFFALEILGVSIGITAQTFFRRNYQQKQKS